MRTEGAKSKPAIAASALAAGAAAFMYGRTLLPGLDLGDTASFQTIVTLPVLVPRHAYPLYFALGKLFLLVPGGEPSHALNVLSAVAGTAAVAATAWLAWELTGRASAALWSALLFAGSYTFWSQAVIAEVYTLEALFIAAVLIAVLRWWRRPTTSRLVVLYGIYALSFGNHLGMILLAPALIWMLWCGRTRASCDPFSLAGIALAAAIALAGALQYSWNAYGLWMLAAPRPPWSDLLTTFWFDVTKSDWRQTLVGTVPRNQWPGRLAMYWWDLRQQFGAAGVAVAVLGVVSLFRGAPAPTIACVLAYLVTFAFAFIYNVGDTHVFLLPSHQVIALFAACGIAVMFGAAARLAPMWRAGCVVALFVVPIWRIADTWPAVDRSSDHRGDRYADAAVAGLTPANSVYLGDLNWQTQNDVGYELTVHRPALPRAFVSQVLWHFPEFVRRNHDLGRDIVLTKEAADTVASAYGSLFRMDRDSRLPVSRLSLAGGVQKGEVYILVVITPLPELVYDSREVAEVARAVAGVTLPPGRYTVIAGRAGEDPAVNATRHTPFRIATALAGHRYDIRIESWLPFDTMRRAGFGHVIVDHRHALTLERGATLGVFTEAGMLKDATNQGGSFALQPRYVIPVLR